MSETLRAIAHLFASAGEAACALVADATALPGGPDGVELDSGRLTDYEAGYQAGIATAYEAGYAAGHAAATGGEVARLSQFDTLRQPVLVHSDGCTPAHCVPGCEWGEELERLTEAGYIRDDELTRAASHLPVPDAFVRLTIAPPCGMLQHSQAVDAGQQPYKCTLDAGHTGDHEAWADRGVVLLARWPA